MVIDDLAERGQGGRTYNQVFDAENRLISVTVSGQTTQFVYDGDGHLVKQIHPDGSRTIYMGGIYEVDKNSAGTVTSTKTYYPAAGAMRINNDVYYVLKDHLGSASVVTNASGNVVGEQRYYPFGETRFMTGSMFTDKLFTGQREMADLGIYHYQARFYSPYINHFLQPDSIIPNLFNPQSLNRYAYVLNNPIRYTDPTGHYIPCEPGEGCTGNVYPSSPNQNNEGGDDPPGPDFLDPEMLERTQYGMEVYEFYVRLYWDSTGWWWQTYGADGHFSAMEFIAMMWGYEMDVVASDDVNYDEVYPDFMEAMVRNSREYCQALPGGCDISSVTGQFMYLSYYSQSTQQRALDPTPDMYMLNNDRVEGGSNLAAAIQNPAAFGHPEWNDGLAGDQPYSVGNESNFLTPPRYWLHKIDGGDPMYVLTGCQWLDAKGYQDLFTYMGCTLP